MKYSYVLLGLLLGYFFFDFDFSTKNAITKKRFFEISEWDNVTFTSVFINKDKDLATINFDLYQDVWYSNQDNQQCLHNTTNLNIENLCYKNREVKVKDLTFSIQLPRNHEFEKELIENNYTKDLDVMYINNPKPNYLLEMINKIIFYLIIFLVFKTILSNLTGAFVEGVQQATETGTPFRIIKPFDPKNKNLKTVKLQDIAGYKDTKDEVEEYIEYLK